MSSPPALPATPHELNMTYGVLFIGFVLGVTLYGLTFFQTYIYYTRYPKDNVFIKYMAGGLWCLDTFTTGLVSHTLYYYLITSFMAQYDEIDVTRTFVSEKAIASGAIFIVQIFYSYRTWIFNDKNPALAGLTITLALVSLVFGLISAVHVSQQPLFASMVNQTIKIELSLNEGFSMLCDLVILGTHSFFLQKSRNPGMKIPKDWFETGVLYLINRGTMFTILQIALLSTVITMPNQPIWILFHIVISKVYINSLFALLNTRRSHRGRGLNEEDSMNQNIGDSKNTSSTVDSSTEGRRTRPLQFNVVNTLSKPGQTMTIELGPMKPIAEGGEEEAEMQMEKASVAEDTPAEQKRNMGYDEA